MGLTLVGAAMLVFIAWDLGVCGGKRCAQLVDRFVLFPRVRARRRTRCDSSPASPSRPTAARP